MKILSIPLYYTKVNPTIWNGVMTLANDDVLPWPSQATLWTSVCQPTCQRTVVHWRFPSGTHTIHHKTLTPLAPSRERFVVAPPWIFSSLAPFYDRILACFYPHPSQRLILCYIPILSPNHTPADVSTVAVVASFQRKSIGASRASTRKLSLLYGVTSTLGRVTVTRMNQ